MAHDFSHLDDIVTKTIISHVCYEPGLVTKDHPAWSDYARDGASIVSSILDAITPSDLAALLAERCPGWVAMPVELTPKMRRAWHDCDHEETADGDWGAFLSAAPKLGDE